MAFPVEYSEAKQCNEAWEGRWVSDFTEYMGGVKQEKDVINQFRIWLHHHNAHRRKCQGSSSNLGVHFLSDPTHLTHSSTARNAPQWEQLIAGCAYHGLEVIYLISFYFEIGFTHLN